MACIVSTVEIERWRDLTQDNVCTSSATTSIDSFYREIRVDSACNKPWVQRSEVAEPSTIATWYCKLLRVCRFGQMKDIFASQVMRLFRHSHLHSGGFGRFDYLVSLNNGFTIPYPRSHDDYDEMASSRWLTYVSTLALLLIINTRLSAQQRVFPILAF